MLFAVKEQGHEANGKPTLLRRLPMLAVVSS